LYKYSESNNILMDRFPRMKSIYAKDVDTDGTPFYQDIPYVFYEGEFSRYILREIDTQNEEELKTIFDFIEDMFLNGDDEIKNLIGVAVVEHLVTEEAFMRSYKKLAGIMGKLTIQSFEVYFPFKNKRRTIKGTVDDYLKEMGWNE